MEVVDAEVGAEGFEGGTEGKLQRGGAAQLVEGWNEQRVLRCKGSWSDGSLRVPRRA